VEEGRGEGEIFALERAWGGGIWIGREVDLGKEGHCFTEGELARSRGRSLFFDQVVARGKGEKAMRAYRERESSQVRKRGILLFGKGIPKAFLTKRRGKRSSAHERKGGFFIWGA